MRGHIINSSTDPLRWGSGEDGNATWPLDNLEGRLHGTTGGKVIDRAGTYQFKNLTIDDNTLINIGSVGEFRNGITIFATGKVIIGDGVIFNAQPNTNKFRNKTNYRFAGADTNAPFAVGFTGGGGGGGAGSKHLRVGIPRNGKKGNYPRIFYTTGNGGGRGGMTSGTFKLPIFYPNQAGGVVAEATPGRRGSNSSAYWLDTQNSYVHGKYSAAQLKNAWNYTGKGNRDEHVEADDGTSASADDNLITKAGHGLILNQTIRFTTLTGGVGLSTSILYYVRPVFVGQQTTSSTFAVSLTVGGDDVAVTTDYSVANYIGERDDYPITAGGDGGEGGTAYLWWFRAPDTVARVGGAGGTGGGMITIIAPTIEFGADCLLYARGASREPTAKGLPEDGRNAQSPTEPGFGGAFMGGTGSADGMNADHYTYKEGPGAGAGGGGGGGLVVLVYTRLKGGDPTIRVYRGRGGTTAGGGNTGGLGGFGADGYFLMGKRNRDRGPITWEKEGGAGIKNNTRIEASRHRGSPSAADGTNSLSRYASSGFVERYYDFETGEEVYGMT